MVAQDLWMQNILELHIWKKIGLFLGKKATKGVNLHKVINTELGQSSIERSM